MEGALTVSIISCRPKFFHWCWESVKICTGDQFIMIASYWRHVECFNTTQYGLRSLCFSGAKLCSLPLDIHVKQITPFSRFRQNVKNSMIDRYNKDTDN